VRKRVILCFVAIAVLSLAPIPVKSALRTLGILHNPGHLLVFAASGVLLLADARSLSSGLRRMAFILLFCAATEALESVIYRNPFEWVDLAIDSLGIALAPLLLGAWRGLKYRIRA